MDIFCKIINGEIPSKRLYEDDVVVVIMDVNPSSNGHSLVIPKKHYQDLFDIEDMVLNHVMMVARDMALKLKERLGCEGITIMQNNGLGQDVKHFHLHLVPKYKKGKKMEIDEVFHIIVD